MDSKVNKPLLLSGVECSNLFESNNAHKELANNLADGLAYFCRALVIEYTRYCDNQLIVHHSNYNFFVLLVLNLTYGTINKSSGRRNNKSIPIIIC